MLLPLSKNNVKSVKRSGESFTGKYNNKIRLEIFSIHAFVQAFLQLMYYCLFSFSVEDISFFCVSKNIV
jgi:hypothetical protein